MMSFSIVLIKNSHASNSESEKLIPWWQVQSIDTMKYSRDLSREKLNDPSFDKTIDLQIKNIADTGATHVSIGTPYDAEFLPMLRRWVNAARKYNLKVWFRGNFSGWEKWFGYSQIDRKTHIEKTVQFIENNSDLFEDGDIFSACPECENGGTGDPRKTNDLVGFREFLLSEYQTTKGEFNKIGKNVASNYNSMNADVAKLVMDKPTTIGMDGVVAVDHYVQNPAQLARDLKDLSTSSGGKIVLGEFGAPILDIHGKMTKDEQAEWIKQALSNLAATKVLIGVNYWVNTGGSTELWDGEGNPNKAVEEITKIFKPQQLGGFVIDETGNAVSNAVVSNNNKMVKTDMKGKFAIPSINTTENVTILASNYFEQDVLLTNNQTAITLIKKDPDLLYKLMKLIHNFWTTKAK